MYTKMSNGTPITVHMIRMIKLFNYKMKILRVEIDKGNLG